MRLLLVLVLFGSLVAAQAPRLTSPEEVARTEVIRRTLPAVVKVQGLLKDPTSGNESLAYGSGFFYSTNRIVTAYHVVDGLRGLSIILSDGRAYPAQIFALDKGIDLAILQVQGLVAPAMLTWGSSQNLPPGMSLLVLGFPMGGRSLVLAGILSGVGPLEVAEDETRNPEIGAEIGEVLYTDARIDVGGSGGPVLDLQGRVVGMVNSVLGGPSGIGGIGVVLPANLVKQSVQDLERFGTPQRGWLGVSMIDLKELDPVLLNRLGLLSDQGAMVDKVEFASPARQAGLRAAQRDQRGKLKAVGDVILAVNGKAVKNKNDVVQAVARYRPGDKVRLTVWRDGRKLEFTLTMIAKPPLSQ